MASGCANPGRPLIGQRVSATGPCAARFRETGFKPGFPCRTRMYSGDCWSESFRVALGDLVATAALPRWLEVTHEGQCARSCCGFAATGHGESCSQHDRWRLVASRARNRPPHARHGFTTLVGTSATLYTPPCSLSPRLPQQVCPTESARRPRIEACGRRTGKSRRFRKPAASGWMRWDRVLRRFALRSRGPPQP